MVTWPGCLGLVPLAQMIIADCPSSKIEELANPPSLPKGRSQRGRRREFILRPPICRLDLADLRGFIGPTWTPGGI